MVLLKYRFDGGKVIKKRTVVEIRRKPFLSVPMKITNKMCMFFFISKEDRHCRQNNEPIFDRSRGWKRKGREEEAITW